MAELFCSIEDLISVLERPKFLVTPCLWLSPNPKSGERVLTIKGSLSDGTATILGVSLRAKCSPEGFSWPSSILLTADYKGKPRVMARVDINGLRHQNRHAVCGNLQHVDAGTTHFHDTRLHRAIPIDELFSEIWNLPVASPIGDMPEDFSQAMEKCGELLHIDNLTMIEEPQWQPRQFHF